LNGVFAHVEEYDPVRDTWRRLADLPVPRHGIDGAVSRALDGVKRRAYVAAGGPRAGSASSTVHHSFEYDTVSQCVTAADCEDGDSCTRATCAGGLCEHVPAVGGDVDGNGAVQASDALVVLRASVGAQPCDCACDVNRTNGVTAADALLLLRVALGLEASPDCPCGAL
jgi:hypothetical protein